jgi:hypothetical protein
MISDENPPKQFLFFHFRLILVLPRTRRELDLFPREVYDYPSVSFLVSLPRRTG